MIAQAPAMQGRDVQAWRCPPLGRSGAGGGGQTLITIFIIIILIITIILIIIDINSTISKFSSSSNVVSCNGTLRAPQVSWVLERARFVCDFVETWRSDRVGLSCSSRWQPRSINWWLKWSTPLLRKENLSKSRVVSRIWRPQSRFVLCSSPACQACQHCIA